MNYDQPVREPVVTSPYGLRTIFGQQSMHNGIDYVTAGDDGSATPPVCRDIYAITSGTVIYSKHDYSHELAHLRSNSGGNIVIVRHQLGGKNYYVRYVHLSDNKTVLNQNLRAGAKIGTYSDWGRTTGPHLHLDIYTMDWKRIDPREILSKGGIAIEKES